MDEIWKDIPGFDGRYQVSNLGSVRSLVYRGAKSPHVLAQALNRNGYASLTLKKEGRSYCFRVHRLVLSTFIGPCPPDHEGAHLDGSRTNNRLENLKWATRKENCAHKKLHGTQQVGETANCAKLSTSQVIAIIERHTNGETQRSLGRAFGVTEWAISRIVRKSKLNWKHVVRPTRARKVLPRALKTHCHKGHVFRKETTRIQISKEGKTIRRCRTCELQWRHELRALSHGEK